MSIEPVRTYVGNIDDDCHQIGVCMLARVRFATLAPPRKTYFCATEHHSSFAGVRLYRSADSLPLSICLCGRLSLLCLSDIDTGGDGDDNNKRTNEQTARGCTPFVSTIESWSVCFQCFVCWQWTLTLDWWHSSRYRAAGLPAPPAPLRWAERCRGESTWKAAMYVGWDALWRVVVVLRWSWCWRR